MEDESDSLECLDESEESVQEADQERAVDRKRRKSIDEGKGQQESETDAEYDEDEAALQHALALSLANTPEADGKFSHFQCSFVCKKSCLERLALHHTRSFTKRIGLESLLLWKMTFCSRNESFDVDFRRAVASVFASWITHACEGNQDLLESRHC